MKKAVYFIIFFLIPVFSFSQNVTSIEAIQESLDSIRLRWKSTLATGEFVLYYNNKQIISDRYKLADSELITKSNFTGVDVGGVYQYEYIFTPRKKANYFFAITVNDTTIIDQQARLAINDISLQQSVELIPEINITVQPISIRSVNYNSHRDTQIKKHTIKNTLLTSLELKSVEDMFHLRWNVFPKDKSQYVFIVYRSRYPIIQYKSPKGLPEYARVTNQFSFEDRNIGFEIPYYYAVVAENSLQWDSGINVFTQPAILLRKSPPFRIKPTTEYVKRQETLSFNIQDFSDETIEQAVQQTLSNLHLLADLDNQQRVLEDILIPIGNDSDNTLLSNLLETPILLQQQDSSIKLNDLNGNSIIQQQNIDLKEFLTALEKHKKTFLKKEYENFNKIVKDNSDIAEKIEQLHKIEEQLLFVEDFSPNQMKKKLNSYYDLRDQISLARHRVQGIIQNMNANKKIREQEFLNSQLALKTRFENKQISQLSNNIIKNKKHLEQYLYNKKINLLSKNIILQASQADATKSLSVFNPTLETDNTEKFIQNHINRDNLQLSNIINARNNSMFQHGEYPQKMNVEGKAFNIDTVIDNNFREVKSYYNDISVEDVPDINDIKNEKWITVKETWIHRNRNVWNSKQNLWKRRMQEILGEEYGWIYSKWMNPSSTVALQEGRKAFQQQNYKESLYLLSFVSDDHNAMMALGQSYYHLGAYKDALNVFVTAINMKIPEAREWMDQTAKKILNRDL